MPNRVPVSEQRFQFEVLRLACWKSDDSSRCNDEILTFRLDDFRAMFHMDPD